MDSNFLLKGAIYVTEVTDVLINGKTSAEYNHSTYVPNFSILCYEQDKKRHC